MINHLVRIKEGHFINCLCIVKDEDHIGYFITNHKTIIKWVDKYEVEVIFKEPQFNHYHFVRCYWCGTTLKFFKETKITNESIYYCPKCLR